MFRFALCFALTAASLLAGGVYDVTYHIDTNTMTARGGYWVGTGDLTVGGKPSQTFESMCIDFHHTITDGQKYQATITPISSFTSGADGWKYQMAAWIYVGSQNLSLLDPLRLNAADDRAGLQYLLWDLFGDHNLYSSTSLKQAFHPLIGAEWNSVDKNTTLATMSMLNSYAPKSVLDQLDDVYIVQGYGRSGDVQAQIVGGNFATPVPEPGSMAMIGTGILAIGYLVRRRRAS